MTATLTPRELQVLGLYARLGWRRDVANELGLTIRTVDAHLTHAYAKLGADGGIRAFHAVGWLKPPGAEEIEAISLAPKVERVTRLIREAQDALNELRTPAIPRGVSSLDDRGGLIAANPASSYTAPPAWRQG